MLPGKRRAVTCKQSSENTERATNKQRIPLNGELDAALLEAAAAAAAVVAEAHAHVQDPARDRRGRRAHAVLAVAHEICR